MTGPHPQKRDGAAARAAEVNRRTLSDRHPIARASPSPHGAFADHKLEAAAAKGCARIAEGAAEHIAAPEAVE